MTTERFQATHASPEILRDVAEACRRIPPLWDLENYVAVNPFLGFAGTPIESASRTIEAGIGGRVLPGLDYYRLARRDGRLSARSISGSAARAGLDASQLEAALELHHTSDQANLVSPLRTLAESYDDAHGTRLAGHVRNAVARWCAVYASDGGPQWGNVRLGRGLFASWLQAARIDRSLAVLGLRGWRPFMRQVPDYPEHAIAAMVDRIGVTESHRTEYFYRLLGRLYGWACYFRRDEWQRGSETLGAVGELLAIQLCADAAVGAIGAIGATQFGAGSLNHTTELPVRLALQEALEDEYVAQVLGSLVAMRSGTVVARPAAQAAFCIDVRSELLRRHLEAQDDSVQTIGFAGFFGVSLDWHSGPFASARCPVLLNPSVAASSRSYQGSRFPGVMTQVQSAPSSAFSYVEMLGLAYGVRLAADVLGLGVLHPSPDEQASFSLCADARTLSLSVADQVMLAAGIVKNMSLTGSLARVVILCGHVGRSVNNPHAAGLDCGACGGHGGAINARVAASILNSVDVRSGLTRAGVVIPEDTFFLPAIHDTSIDEVRFLDTDAIPTSHVTDVARLREWLDSAGELTRLERSASLGIHQDEDEPLRQSLNRRSRDWSEVRPEWGLARNAAFIAARRSRSRGVNLHGRAFLHDYDAALDTDGSVLSLILSAPMVVASWINLQYFASTVDNDVFGCGNKALHNRIASIGVVLGNGGDLRTGLALQAVHASDGTFYHEPIRLQVIVEAPTERIDAVLESQSAVKTLVDNEWVRLFALQTNSQGAYRRLRDGSWEAVAQ